MTKAQESFNDYKMALQQQSASNRSTGSNGGQQHHCRDCGVYFESSKSLEVHLQYHKENLLTKWANQASINATGGAGGDSENNNIKRSYQSSVTAPADSTEMKTVTTTSGSGPGRPSSTTSYPPTTSPFQHPQTPASYSSAPSPYQNDVPSSGPSSSSTTFGYPEQYQLPYNGYRSPCQPAFMLENNQQQPTQDPGYMLSHGGEFTANGTAAPQPAQTGLRSTTPNSPSSSSSYRYMYKNEGFLDKNGVSSSSPQSPHQCEKCGFICESQTMLQDHVKTSHPPSPPAQGPTFTGSAFQPPDFYHREKEAVQDSPDILDLDSQQKVFREEEQTTTNPHSISSMLSPWTNKQQQQPFSLTQQQQQPYRLAHSNNHQPSSYPSNGPVQQQQQTPPVSVPQAQYQPRVYPEPYNNVPQPPVPTINQIPNATSPKLTVNNTSQQHSKGDSWKSNEARRPKTYNCSACNKWFTSSGHLKRHYNTTLHKNAVKQSGHPDPATLPISSHHHPNRDPNYILSSKTPPGMSNPPPNLPKAKKTKAISPVDSNNTPSPALSNTNTEDSSRSNDNVYERSTYERGLPNGGFGNGSTGFEQPYERQQSYEQRTTPSGFDSRGTNIQPQNGFSAQEPARPPSSPNYDYYRDYNRLPVMNQANSTNQLSAQPPNYQAGPSVSPSGGLPICPPSLLFLRTQNPTTITYMGETITIQRTNEQSRQQPLPLQADHRTTPPSTSNHTITGNELSTTTTYEDEEEQNTTPLPSFSNFQNYGQASYMEPTTFPNSPCATLVNKPFYCPSDYSTEEFSQPTDYTTPTDFTTTSNYNHNYPYIKEEPKSDYIKLENMDYSYVPEYSQETTDGEVVSDIKIKKQVSEKECQTSFSYTNVYDIGFKQKNRRDRSPPLSPQEYPSSTILDMTERKTNKQKNKKINKKKQEESSNNMVSSTGSPKPATKKDVIKCEECDKTFNRICYLTQHNRSFHCGEKPYKCDRCGKRFHSENRAKDHSRKHGGEKPYKCDVCPKSFNHKTDLRRHLCLHTGQKPFPCEVCGKGFIRKDHMIKHFHTHKTGKRKFLQTLDEIESEKSKVQ